MEENNNVINTSYKVYVKLTEEKGYGVFAKTNIKEGEIIETCYCIKAGDIRYKNNPSPLMDYVFNYPKGMSMEQGAILVLPLGFGCIYNHDNDANAKWENHPTLDMYFEFIALRDIGEGEEICTNYGKHYWPNHIKRQEQIKTNQDGNIQ